MSQDNNILQKIETLQNKIQSWHNVIYIGFSASPDALIAACIIGKVLIDRETPFILSYCANPLQEVKDRKYRSTEDETVSEDHHHFIFIGHHKEQLDKLDNDLDFIAISHSKAKEVDDNILIPNEFGYEYPNMTLSSISFDLCQSLITHLIGTREYILPLPLIAQHSLIQKSELFGRQKEIFDEGVGLNLISSNKALGILGSTLFTINEALVYSQDPFLPNLTDNDNQVVQLLLKANIPTENPDGERKFSDLDGDEIRDLNSKLVVYLSTHSGFRNNSLELIKTKIKLLKESPSSLLSNTWDYARSIRDCINRKQFSLIISILLGKRGTKLRELTKLFREERKLLINSYDFLLDKKEKVVNLSNLRYLKTDKKISWYNATAIANIALAGELVNIDLPFLLIVPGPDDLITFGLAASNHLKFDIGFQKLLENILKNHNILTPVLGDKYSAFCTLMEKNIEQIIEELNIQLGVKS